MAIEMSELDRVVQAANIDPEIKKVLQQILAIRSQQIDSAVDAPSRPNLPDGPSNGGLPASVPEDFATLFEAVNGILGLMDQQATYINNISQILNSQGVSGAPNYPADCPTNLAEMYSLPPPQTQPGK